MTSLLPEHLLGFALVDNVLLIILLPITPHAPRYAPHMVLRNAGIIERR